MSVKRKIIICLLLVIAVATLSLSASCKKVGKSSDGKSAEATSSVEVASASDGSAEETSQGGGQSSDEVTSASSGGEQETHEFAAEWTYDGEYHWHACLTEGCDQVDGKSEHAYGDAETLPAGCENDGHVKKVCDVCGYENVEVLPAKGHNYSAEWSADGEYHWHACLNDGCDSIDSKGEHVFAVTETVSADCENDGYVKKVCTECGYEKTDILPAAGHDYYQGWSCDDEYHWHACLNDGCDSTDGKSQHSYGDAETVEASCETNGYIKTACTVCGYEKIEVLPAYGHNLAAEWSTDGEYHWHACLNDGCDYQGDKSAHAFDNAEIKATATKLNAGKIGYVCSACAYEKEVDIPAIPDEALEIGNIGGVNDGVKQYETYLVRDDDTLTLIGISDSLLTDRDGLLIYVNLLGMVYSRSRYTVAVQGVGSEITWAVYFPNNVTTDLTAEQVALCNARFEGNAYYLTIDNDLFDGLVDREGYSFADTYFSFTINAKGNGGETYDFLQFANVVSTKHNKIVNGTQFNKYVYATNVWYYLYVSEDNEYVSYDDIKAEDEMNYSLAELDAIVAANDTLRRDGKTLSENMAQVAIDSSVYTTASMVKSEYGTLVFPDRNTRMFESFASDALMGMYFTQRNCGSIPARYLEAQALTDGYVLLTTITSDTKVDDMWVKIVDESNAPGILNANYFYSIYAAYVQAGDTIIVGGNPTDPCADELMYTNAGYTTITGNVKDMTGQPLTGATVSLNGVDKLVDENGAFSFKLDYIVGRTYDLVLAAEGYDDIVYVIDENVYLNRTEYDYGDIVFTSDNILYAGKVGGTKAKLFDIYLAKEETDFTVIGVADQELTADDSIIVYINLFGMTQWRNQYIFAVRGKGNDITYSKYFANNANNDFTAEQNAMFKALYSGNVYRLSIPYALIDPMAGIEGYSFKNSSYSFMLLVSGAGGEDTFTYGTLASPVYNTVVRSDYNVASATQGVSNSRPCQWVYVSKDNKFASYSEVVADDPLNYSLAELDAVIASSSVYREGYTFSENMAKVAVCDGYENASLVTAAYGDNIFNDNNNRKFEYFCNEALIGMYYTKKPGGTNLKTSWYVELTAETSGYLILTATSADNAVNSMWTKVIAESNAHGILDNAYFYSIYAMWVNAGDTVVVGGTPDNPVGQQLLFTLANSDLLL